MSWMVFDVSPSLNRYGEWFDASNIIRMSKNDFIWFFVQKISCISRKCKNFHFTCKTLNPYFLRVLYPYICTRKIPMIHCWRIFLSKIHLRCENNRIQCSVQAHVLKLKSHQHSACAKCCYSAKWDFNLHHFSHPNALQLEYFAD